MRIMPIAIAACLFALLSTALPARAQDGCDAIAADLDHSGSVDAGDIALLLLYFGDIDPCCSVDCNDNDPNTVDSCVNGVCQHVNPCEDGNLCTVDTADPKTGACVHTPKNCSDSNWCSDDSCNPTTGACVHVTSPNGRICDDGNLCTIVDACVAGTCFGQAKNCNDNNPCTVDSCVSGNCVNTPTGCFWGGPDQMARMGKCTLTVCGAIPNCCEVGWDDLCLEFAASVDACTGLDQPIDPPLDQIR